jgi:hypothetical protein
MGNTRADSQTRHQARLKANLTLSNLVLLVSTVTAVVGAYLLNPIFEANQIRGFNNGDLGLRVFFNGMKSDNEPIILLRADDSGVTLQININPSRQYK